MQSAKENSRYIVPAEINLIQLTHLISVNDVLNTLVGNKKVAYGSVMVKCIDDVCNVLTHVTVDVPFFGQKLGRLVNQVGSKDSCDGAFFISLIEAVETVGEKSEGSEDEDSVGISGL